MTLPIQFSIRLIHWAMAALILAMLISGFFMVNTQAYSLYPWHKSFGVIAAVAIALRLYWRSQQRWVSSTQGTRLELPVRLAHGLILLLLVLMPASGFMLSGLGGYGVALFGVEIVPSNFNAAGSAVPISEPLAALGYRLHTMFAITLSVLLTLHILAALKHHCIDKDATLRRMVGRA
ncbi:cytochrome b/b6 domain-containing protein [Gilvimarinus sp. SDUM040013]|uniref:Cytochrome b/b6 domain-containing protein n=1 Tax=Gilvimarinus gilvus TaxID=3058038 RepID=A0ABU4S630_9GAMM|nr:cytochrome b/b6 domain-containing protein [Gilvimarinus sp. SDUM040013]MDO3387496.1 cytochrome b/b6 domain-containing protein [Gilvimarinus sp. SDUM040013]MDX6851358.1 cytochrome b/b6 domain-containing protein [Gilvimarinus sp. SDUM040013]